MSLRDIVRLHLAGQPKKPQMFMRPEQVEQELQDLQDAYKDGVEELAQRVWKGVVVPVCKQFGFQFRSSPGGYTLSTMAGEKIADTRDAVKKGYRLEEFFQILDIPTTSGPLGAWMPNYLG